MSSAPVIVWFRNDLRIQDNPALNAALQRGAPIIPVYILDEAGEGKWKIGGATRSWLHHSLKSLIHTFKDKESELVLCEGDSLQVLQQLIKKTGVSTVFWNRRYEPDIIKRDSDIKTALNHSGIEAKSFNAALLHEPHTVSNKSGLPFQVFTPFWKHCLTLQKEDPAVCKLTRFPKPDAFPKSLKLEDLNLLPALGWDKGFYESWHPGEAGAHKRLAGFLKTAAEDYSDQRNIPSRAGTSGLSPHLHFGEISPRQIWKACVDLKAGDFTQLSRGAQVFLSEVGWREFAFHLLFHFPKIPNEALRSEFNQFPWKKDAKALKAWQKGKTGYPIIDAGMRELWVTGWMHNRVRMIAGSFLVKDLLITWEEGVAWFWDTLIDADLASNTMGWQWVSGCGADAAPYFRIFNPILQGLKFDPDGYYVRKWVPELSKLPNEFIHAPWEAPHEVLEKAGIILGKHYPKPMVDHSKARDLALEALQSIKKK